jgi:peptidoglycan/xylan/chitin deacetylase (PgdA/CDA1 family)
MAATTFRKGWAAGSIWRSVFGLASPAGAAGRLSILIFHRTLAKPDPLFPGEPHAERFDALCAHLRSRFEVLPLAHAVASLRDGTLPSRALSITFDDGYADNLLIAGPILRKHGLPATVFIATGYLDGGCMWNDRVIEAFRATQREQVDLSGIGMPRCSAGSIDERRAAIDQVINATKYLPISERNDRANYVLRAAGVAMPTELMLPSASLRSLDEFGIDIGAHTINHPILARSHSDEAWREISESKRRLQDLVGKPVRLFAYPNGKPGHDYRAEHVAMVRDAGFEAAVNTASGVATAATDVYQLPRFTPWARDPLKFDLLMLRNLCHPARLNEAMRDVTPAASRGR